MNYDLEGRQISIWEVVDFKKNLIYGIIKAILINLIMIIISISIYYKGL